MMLTPSDSSRVSEAEARIPSIIVIEQLCVLELFIHDIGQ